MIDAVNPKREMLGLPPLVELEATTSLKDGVATATPAKGPGRVPKVQAAADVTTLVTALDALCAESFIQACAAATASAAELGGDAESLTGVAREAMLKSALELFDNNVCPVCDTALERGAFRGHVASKLEHLAAVTAKRAALEAQIKPILDRLHAAGTALATVIGYGGQFIPPVDVAALKDFKAILLGRYQQLEKLLPLDDTRTVLAACSSVPDLSGAIAPLRSEITAIPEPTKQDAARDFLVVAQERLAQYRTARQNAVGGKAKAERAAKVFAVFGDVTTKALENIYKQIETAFSGYYRKINHEDESKFTAMLMPSIGKLAFNVDFYGRGHFPPGAYHSEGHQDGMGLCLYLALMNHLLGAGFTFAVLDDVLMSVDAGHRREVCGLLKETFPNTQFIFTTHDEIWLKHMKVGRFGKGPQLCPLPHLERRPRPDRMGRPRCLGRGRRPPRQE